jgi:Rrf2 family transcriptional regulator, iron-sulfur cluster assembly transcription factor
MLTRACGYAVRAAVFLAKHAQDGFVPVHEMSRVLDISPSFLSKIVRELSRSELIESYRGPNGGVALARPAESICVKDIVLAIDGPELFTCCVLGLPGCGTEKPCPLHHEWSRMRGEIERSFGKMDLATLAARPAEDLDELTGDLTSDGLPDIDHYIVSSSRRKI